MTLPDQRQVERTPEEIAREIAAYRLSGDPTKWDLGAAIAAVIRAEREARERAEAERDDLREQLEYANQPFLAWVLMQEDFAIRLARAGKHIFLQDHDEEATACLRCLCIHPDAGQGCIEYKRTDHINAKRARDRLALKVERLETAVGIAANTLGDVAAVGWSPAVDAKRWAADLAAHLRAALSGVDEQEKG